MNPWLLGLSLNALSAVSGQSRGRGRGLETMQANELAQTFMLHDDVKPTSLDHDPCFEVDMCPSGYSFGVDSRSQLTQRSLMALTSPHPS